MSVGTLLTVPITGPGGSVNGRTAAIPARWRSRFGRARGPCSSPRLLSSLALLEPFASVLVGFAPSPRSNRCDRIGAAHLDAFETHTIVCCEKFLRVVEGLGKSQPRVVAFLEERGETLPMGASAIV
jgi:hypothetical protein